MPGCSPSDPPADFAFLLLLRTRVHTFEIKGPHFGLLLSPSVCPVWGPILGSIWGRYFVVFGTVFLQIFDRFLIDFD